MKQYTQKLIQLILTCYISSHTLYASYSIVFVHIGSTLPSYLAIAVEQARLFNPDCTLYLVANQPALQQYTENSPSDPTLIKVPCESLAPSAEHTFFRNHSKLNKEFRNGFWNHASERFFYLSECITQYQLEHIFHLENDMMLYVNLHKLMPTFMATCPALGATFDNEQRCIPGFMYIRNARSLQPLVHYIAHATARTDTHHDMATISQYHAQHGPSAITALPIIMPEYILHYPLRSNAGHTTQRPAYFAQHAEQFHSIFDAAALGQYLGGIDPRNGPSQPGFINESCLFNPSYLTIVWQQDEGGHRVPYARCKEGDRLWRINNLHIHSKNLSAFKS